MRGLLAEAAVDRARVAELRQRVVTTHRILAAVAQETCELLAAGTEWYSIPSTLLPQCEAVEAKARAYVQSREGSPPSRRPHGDGPASTTIPYLTSTERQIISLLPSRLSFSEIGERLGVGPVTARATAIALYQRLGVVSRADAVERALVLGVAEQP
jgi:ATP/maltotriose-dependent transcriptional regulator MalT